MNLKTKLFFFIILALLLTSAIVFGQDASQITNKSASNAITQDIDMLVKIAVAIITGIATLLGIPIIFLTYRKTRAEIRKLELEANAIRAQQTLTHPPSVDDRRIHILLDNSPHSRIQVLADPRFLAPLLILLDFMFAWIILTIFSRFFSIFSFGLLSQLVLVILALLLFIPIALQILRVRNVLKPPSAEEIDRLRGKYRIIAYLLYVMVVMMLFLYGILFLNISELTNFGRYFAWLLISCGVLILLLSPLLKRKLDDLIASIYINDNEQKMQIYKR